MIELLRSELLRMRSRRVVWVLTICAATGILVGVTIGAMNSHRPTPQEIAQAQARYERLLDECMSGQYLTEDDLPDGFDSLPEFCEQAVGEFGAAGPRDTMELVDLRAITEGLGTMVILLGAVLGATLVGADWASGTYATLLTWEPRRFRALLVRVIAVMVTVVVVTAGLQALFVASYRVAVALRGSAAGAPPDWLDQVAGVSIRVTVAATAIAIIAAALATIGRSTVLAVGALFGYLVIVEGFLSGLVDDLERWLLVRALSAVVLDRPPLSLEEGLSSDVVMSVARGRVVIVGYVVVLVAAAAVVMRRRDVQ